MSLTHNLRKKYTSGLRGFRGFPWQMSVIELLCFIFVDCTSGASQTMKKGMCSFWFWHLYIWTNFGNVNYSFCGTQIKSPYRIRYPLKTAQTLLSVTVGDMCFAVVARNQTVIGKICVIISNTHKTLPWVTRFGGVFVGLKPSTIVNGVIQYVIMIWFYTERCT